MRPPILADVALSCPGMPPPALTPDVGDPAGANGAGVLSASLQAGSTVTLIAEPP